LNFQKLLLNCDSRTCVAFVNHFRINTFNTTGICKTFFQVYNKNYKSKRHQFSQNTLSKTELIDRRLVSLIASHIVRTVKYFHIITKQRHRCIKNLLFVNHMNSLKISIACLFKALSSAPHKSSWNRVRANLNLNRKDRVKFPFESSLLKSWFDLDSKIWLKLCGALVLSEFVAMKIKDTSQIAIVCSSIEPMCWANWCL